MNRDEIIRMAREAGLFKPYAGDPIDLLERFVALVAQSIIAAEIKDDKTEPVAWLVDGEKLYFTREIAETFSYDSVKPLYAAPPMREWQGLTDEDLSVCDEDGVILARYWEAKLKEKNA